MDVCKHGAELQDSAHVGQCLDDVTKYQGRFVPFSNYNLSLIRASLFTSFAFANHVLTSVIETSTQTAAQVFDSQLFLSYRLHQQYWRQTYFLDDLGTPITSAHPFLRKC